MYENERQRGFVNIITGALMMACPMCIQFIVGNETSQTDDVFTQVWSILEPLSAICRYLGLVNVLIGVISLVIGFANPYGYSYEAYDRSENALVFWVLNGRKKKNIYVKLDKLSSNTVKELRLKIEVPLQNLYEVANKGKRAKEEYRNCEMYISSLANDLEKAVNQCENELMEKKLLDKLYIIENAIRNIKDKVDEAITTDKDEERFLKELQLESFEPFLATENINKLEKGYTDVSELEKKYQSYEDSDSSKKDKKKKDKKKKDKGHNNTDDKENGTFANVYDYGQNSIWNEW